MPILRRGPKLDMAILDKIERDQLRQLTDLLPQLIVLFGQLLLVLSLIQTNFHTMLRQRSNRGINIR